MVDETTVVKKKRKLLEEAGMEVPSLIIIHGADIGKKFDLHKDEMNIGRSDKCDIHIDDEELSRVHATVICRNEEYAIRDEDSTNGVFVNTKKIKEQGLNDGDLILAGNTIFKFMVSGSIEGQYHESIYRLATLDGLTQIYNKKYLLEKSEAEFSRARRYQRDLSLILFDFDHFKKINDEHGHPAGDYVLQQTASVLMKNMRKEDTLGRYGGEELMVIMPETEPENAFRLADKLRLLIQTIDFNFAGKSIPVTVSGGVGGRTAATATFQDLLSAVDKALYQAKKEGRNKVVKA